MTRTLLILRPEPGAAATAARAAAAGFSTVAVPLFRIGPLAWSPPEPAGFDAIMLTSANAARHAGPALARYLHLPAYAVGDATARAARAGGFATISTGAADGAALVAAIGAEGPARLLHLCGREHRPLGHPALSIATRTVYAADAIGRLPADALAALADGAIALLHSPRAATLFRSLIAAAGIAPAGLRVAAISPAALAAAGPGWSATAAAAAPNDDALLAAAARLCD